MTAIYHDCEEYFTQALQAPNGIAVELDSKGQAIHFMQKMNAFRAHHRKKSQKVYDLDDPKYGKTPWDDIQVKMDKSDECSVIIQRATIKVKGVRTL